MAAIRVYNARFSLLLYVRVRALFSFPGNPATLDAFEATTNRYSTNDSELVEAFSRSYTHVHPRDSRENSFLRLETRPLNPGSVRTKISQLIFRDDVGTRRWMDLSLRARVLPLSLFSLYLSSPSRR